MRAVSAQVALMLVAAAMATGARAPAHGPVADVSGLAFLPNGQPAARLTLRGMGSIDQLYPGRNSTPPGASLAGDLRVSVRTDARGHYRVRLDPDSPWYQAHFTWEAGVSASWNMRLISPQGYGTLDVRIEPGQHELVRDIRLEPGDRLSGKVVAAATGKPIAGATVHVVMYVGWSVPFSQVETDARGRFVVPDQLPPGEYQVGADAKDWALLATPLPPPAPAGQKQKGRARQLTFKMVPRSFTVRVLLLQADGKPLRNKSVQCWLKQASLGIGVGGGLIGPWPQPTDHRGTFTFRQSSGPDLDLHRFWALAYPYITVWAEYGGRKTNSAKIEWGRPNTKPVVLKLK